MAETTKRLRVSGMHCASCSMLVDMTLEELEGVASAQTDLASAESLVTFDSEIVSLDGLVDAVRKVGYDAEVVG